MKIAYVRTYEAFDRCHLVRDDGSEEAYRFHAYGGALPHELVHDAVEVAFGLRRGLWGCLADGLDLSRVNAHANRIGGAAKYREGLGAALPEVLYSEALTTVAWTGAPEACLAAIEGIVATGEHTPAEPPTAEQVERARTLLGDLHARWLALGPREALQLEYPPCSG